MSILEDACRIGDFAVLDVRYGHYRDRYYRAVDLRDAAVLPVLPGVVDVRGGGDAELPSRLCWCAFNRAAREPGFAPASSSVPRVIGVVATGGVAAPAGRRQQRVEDDAVFLGCPWFLPLKDLELANWRQGVRLDDDGAVLILLALLDALAVDAPPRLPFVDDSTLGVTAAGDPLFFGWRALDQQTYTADAPVRVFGELASLVDRHLFRAPPPPATRSALAVAIIGGAAWDTNRDAAYRASLFADAAAAVERAVNATGRTWALDAASARQRLGDIVRGLFADRIREHDELDEELAMVPLDDLRALPPPK